jgi:hypothetical protein
VSALIAALLACTQPKDSGSQQSELGGETLSCSGELVLDFLEADPDPPDVGDNTWKFQLTDGGSTVAEAEVSVWPVMPAHGHGTVPPSFEAEVADGVYEVGPISLMMAGEREALFEVSAEGLEETCLLDLVLEG